MTFRCKRLPVLALLLGAVIPLAAQQPAPAPDSTARGYAPTVPDSTPPSAPAAAPAPAPTAAPAPAAAAAPAPAPAAAPTPAAAPASRTAGRSVAEALGFIDVIPARSVDRIKIELQAAQAADREADARIAEASSRRSQTKALIEAKKQEASGVDTRMKLAKKEKQEADKASLEAEKRVIERQREFLERRDALHSAEFDRGKAAKLLAQADQKALEMELQLAGRRAERAQVAGKDATATLTHDEVIHELERRTLEAQRQRAEAAKDVASRDQDIARRRLDLYTAQMAAGESK
jgi:hypothetical protein